MLASLFDGARGLFSWTFSWLNFGAGSEAEAVEPSPSVPIPAQPVPLSLREAPTPKGSFEQINRTKALTDLHSWQDAQSPVQTTASPTELLGAVAEVVQASEPAAAAAPDEAAETPATVRLALSFEDTNGLAASDLEALSAVLGKTPLFSPLIQPAVSIELNEAGTAALISLEGPAAPALDQVYLPLDFSLTDRSGDDSPFDLKLPIWNTDLL